MSDMIRIQMMGTFTIYINEQKAEMCIRDSCFSMPSMRSSKAARLPTWVRASV